MGIKFQLHYDKTGISSASIFPANKKGQEGIASGKGSLLFYLQTDTLLDSLFQLSTRSSFLFYGLSFATKTTGLSISCTFFNP